MNTYRINYSTKSLEDGGETGCANITELSESAARRAFKERYRGDGYSIINTELVAEDVSASKEQERRALAQIQEIVRSHGRDSYIGTAFKGCFEIAESNIECDFADNLFDRAELAASRASHYENECVELKAQLEKSRKDAEVAIATMIQVQEQLGNEYRRHDEYVTAEQQAQERADLAEADLHLAGLEVVELKARLYDYMIAVA